MASPPADAVSIDTLITASTRRAELTSARIKGDSSGTTYDKALSLGYVVGHEGAIGGEKGRFAYFDTQAHPGTVVEISDISGTKGRTFEHIRKVAEGWDGTNPIRTFK